MKRLFVLMVFAGLAAMGYVLRDEVWRYTRILRMARRPELVGASVTPQGNGWALQRSEPQRADDRRPGGVAAGHVLSGDGRWAG